jgi:hypothetical protein
MVSELCPRLRSFGYDESLTVDFRDIMEGPAAGHRHADEFGATRALLKRSGGIRGVGRQIERSKSCKTEQHDRNGAALLEMTATIF